MRSDRPIILHGTASVTANAVRGVDDETTLKNPLRAWTQINGIRFLMTTASIFRFSTAATRVRLHIGKHYLTHGFVPLWLLGRVIDDFRERDGAVAAAVSVYWRFPSPLYIPPGEYLVPEFYGQNYLDGTALGSQTVRVQYLARELPEGVRPPDEITIPWVAPYIPASIAAGAAADLVNSNEADLVNPHREVLAVDRFIGRILVNTYDPINYADPTTVNVNTRAYSDLTTVRMEDSAGHIIVRDPTPFGALFSVIDRSWEVRGTLLRPNGYITAYVEYDYSATVTGTLQPHIAMHGRRVINAGELGW